MNKLRRFITGISIAPALLWLSTNASFSGEASVRTHDALVVATSGDVTLARDLQAQFQVVSTNQFLSGGDRVRTAERSRATLRLSNLCMIRVPEITTFTVPSFSSQQRTPLELEQGSLFFYSRERAGVIKTRTRQMTAAVRGTEFVLSADAAGTSRLAVIEGEVEVQTPLGNLTVTSGEEAVAEQGQPPRKAAFVQAAAVIQWYLYYPAVLVPSDLGVGFEVVALQPSLAAYQAGDLAGALRDYPVQRQPATDAERLFLAGLFTSFGRVDRAEELLDTLATQTTGASALKRIIEVVKGTATKRNDVPNSASEMLAESYYHQSRGELDVARTLALNATVRAPENGFAWARVAEMELAFGRVTRAREASARAQKLAPKLAPNLVLTGYLDAAEGRHSAALEHFNTALQTDPFLAPAWAGRALSRLRHGDRTGGVEDLMTAASLEPNRAIYRSYMAKAFAYAGNSKLAFKELGLAKTLDPYDPTAWLYSALINNDHNLVNRSLGDLQKSMEMNGNRAVYRSRLLLDQDQSVRGANLATIYRDARMSEHALDAAALATASDYANASSHLFLANSYELLRDPAQINVRYDTPAISEYLVGVLLAPAGSSSLVPGIARNDPARLIDQNRLGVFSETEYTSHGDISQRGAQYGYWDNTAYSVESRYQVQNGWRINNDREYQQLSFELKHDFDSQNSLYALVFNYSANGGDLLPRRDPTTADPSYRFQETKDPNVIIGYHHQWSPEQHTLAMFGRLTDYTIVNDGATSALTYTVNSGTSFANLAEPAHNFYSSALQNTYLGELQHIVRNGNNTTVFGAKCQAGTFRIQSGLASDSIYLTPFPFVLSQAVEPTFNRMTGYAYDYYRFNDRLTLVAGIAADLIRVPVNFRFAPLSDESETRTSLLPKVGLIYEPWRGGTVRIAYARSRTGADIEGSHSLEPTEVAGIIQSYRSVIPDTLSGGTSGALVDVLGLEYGQKLPDNWYFHASAQVLQSDTTRGLGAFVYDLGPAITPPTVYTQLREKVQYREQSFGASLTKLLGDRASLTGGFRLTQGRFRDSFPDLDSTVYFQDVFNGNDTSLDMTGHLYQTFGRLVTYHPSGIFSDFEVDWYRQEASSMTTAESTQLNAFVGHRAFQRRLEARLGIMNILNYHSTLGPFPQPPAFPLSRTITFRLLLSF